MSIWKAVKAWARRIKGDVILLWFARAHADTPRLAKAIAVVALAYALSPIDLIPDFIPILGFVDEAILLPALIWLAVRLLPLNVAQESRVKAEAWMARQKDRLVSYVGAVAIVVIWLSLLILAWRWFEPYL